MRRSANAGAWRDRVDIDAVLRAQGADPAALRRRGARVVETAAEALRTGLPVLSPAITLGRFPIRRVTASAVHLADGARLSGPLVAAQLAGAREAAVLAVTIGAEIGAAVASAGRDRPSFALALEGMATAALEAWAQEAVRRLDRAARRRRWRAGTALGPGLEGWPLERGQRELFDLLAPNGRSVTLLPGGMMWPRHSLSLVVGLGPGLSRQAAPCDWCGARSRCRQRVAPVS